MEPYFLFKLVFDFKVVYAYQPIGDICFELGLGGGDRTFLVFVMGDCHIRLSLSLFPVHSFVLISRKR